MTNSTMERALMREMGVSAINIERRLKLVGFEDRDSEHIATIRSTVQENADELTGVFFDALASVDEARPLMQDQEAMDLARQLKHEHLLAMVSGPYDEAYAEQRLRLATVYNNVRLDTNVFLGAYNRLMNAVGETIMSAKSGSAVDRFKAYTSLSKIASFDISLIVDALIFERERLERKNDELARAKEAADAANKELEAFCYSVSHDLRAPLRTIDGFSQALSEELPKQLPYHVQRYFDRIRAATLRMGQLIDDLLNLSKVSRGDLQHTAVSLTEIAGDVIHDLQSSEPGRPMDVSVWRGMSVNGDPRLLRVALENLLGNAWKFTSRTDRPCIEVGVMRDADRPVYFVRDNGAGFDMEYVDKLFGAFQRLHSEKEYPGTGIGLATVQRIIHRHGGHIWADAAPGKGATFFFTLAAKIVADRDRAMN